MDTQQLIRRILKSYLDESKSYYQPLPPELAKWYCYTTDGGHSILVAVKSLYDPTKGPESFLVPAPVKTVLRGYTRDREYIIVNLPYSHEVGLIVPAGDDEF